MVFVQRGKLVKHTQKSVVAGILLTGVLAMSACSSEGDFSVTENRPINSAASEDETLSGEGVIDGTLEDETANLVIPQGTNLRINYVDSAYALIAEPDYIVQQWQGMKTCLEVDVPDGYILVEREVLPPSNATDVIQMPDQTFAASVLDREDDAYIQIRVDDFDPSIEDRGYFFRQIIGPYMWRYNGRDARSYDPYCAAFVVR